MDRRVGDIRYRVIGRDGLPWLVVVHGMALDHSEFVPLAETLSDRWRVLLWDMPGHGESQPHPAGYSVAAMTDALETVLAAEAIDRAALLGFSYGGVVAQVFARRHPQRLTALVLHGCFSAYFQPPPMPRALVGPVVGAMFATRRWDRMQRDFVASCAVTEAGRAAIADAPATLGRGGFVAMTKALLRASTPDVGFHVDAPLLLIHGEFDGYATTIGAGFDALAATSPHAQRVVIAGAGHCAHLDAPGAFETAVTGFLDRLSGAAANRLATG